MLRFKDYFLILFLGLAHLVCLAQAKEAVYCGDIRGIGPGKFYVLYKGNAVLGNEGSFLVKDQKLTELWLILVDPANVKCKLKEASVLGLELPTSGYKAYKLSLVEFLLPKNNGQCLSYSWQISSAALEAVPANAIILPLDPNEVELKFKNFHPKASKLAFHLPTIELSSKDQRKIASNLTNACIKLTCLKPFHGKQKLESIMHNATKISILV